MRKAILALLLGAYVGVAIAVGALFWRSATDWGAGVGVGVGVLALLVGVHSLFGRGAEVGGLRREAAALRDAHRLLADQLEETEGALEDLARQLEHDVDGRTRALTGEVRLLEELVARLGADLDARLASPPASAAVPPRPSAALLQIVRDALEANRVDLYLQPTVSLPQRRVAYYESYTRLRDATGRVMLPAEYLTVAEPEGLVGAVDNLLLFRCVQIVRRLAKTDRRIGIFCNISPTSLGDERFFSQFLAFMAENRDLGASLIFELGQAAFDARSPTAARNMARLGELGYRFSIDKVSMLDIDFVEWHRADVRFVKVAADVLLDQLVEVDGRLALKAMPDLAAADFAGLVRRYGVEPIVEKVESEREVIDILELDFAYAQGNLFGEPRPIREQVLAETTPPAPFVQSGLRRGRATGA